MGQKVAKGKGQDNQLATIVTFRGLGPRGFDQNYGAMTTVLEYLTTIEQLRLQGLDKWQYKTGVGRVQVRIQWELFYFANQSSRIVAVSKTGDCQQFDCKGESHYSNVGRRSCQVGRSRLFQFKDGSFRILNIDPSQRSFTVEKSQATRPEIKEVLCLSNFKDRLIFLFCYVGFPRRYSLAEDRMEELPNLQTLYPLSACSLGDKVYVLANTIGKNFIRVLHNPGASISSQGLHWQVIEVPQIVLSPRCQAGFVPLNSTQIAILGGKTRVQRPLGDIITFNSSTCEFKKEMEDNTDPFDCDENQSAKVCQNTVIALVTDKTKQTRLIKYKKGDTCVTGIKFYSQD